MIKLCFNISINKEPEELEERFDASFDKGIDFQRVYHVSALDSPSLPVLTADNPKRFQFFRWGLVPHWVKDKEQAEDIRLKTVNARAETIHEKPSYREPIKNTRCLVVADGFFEWREVGGKNYPYYIKLKNDEAFAFAGIWDRWDLDPDYRSFSIITTEANPLLAKIHNKKKRMPVILTDENRWLEKDIGREDIDEMLKPYDEEKMEAYPIRRLITQKELNDNVPEVLEPYHYRELDFEQKTLF